ncbi:MAG: glycyl-radical enzyme activating protein [Acidobacteriota bacterium]|nr:glycyl-radical enzyme activating protein [Acidobacteriota bacterium]
MNGDGGGLVAVVTNIQGFSLHDGPGIRTVVFFKGCPLACRWCANPECMSKEPQVGFLRTLCADCGRCGGVCPHGAIRPGADVHRIDYALCQACGACADRCGHDALVRYGESMTVAEVWDAVRRDKLFYESSGGGVTVSGGEPLLRAKFVRELFTRCREDGVDTCVETCGFVNQEAFADVLPVTDHFLFDLKHLDARAHEEHTGWPNDWILANASLLVEYGADVLFRQPLVPGVNDSLENITATAEFLHRLGPGVIGLELMPYHRVGQAKYRALDMPYPMEGVDPDGDRAAEAARDAYQTLGVTCTISR